MKKGESDGRTSIATILYCNIMKIAIKINRNKILLQWEVVAF